MKFFGCFVIISALAIFMYKFNVWMSDFFPEKANIPETWWGHSETKKDEKIHPFKINVSEDVLHDLRYRLDHTRPFTKPLENSQWYGFNANLAEEILEHWKTKYDWRAREEQLNRFPQFLTNIQGLNIYFLHVKPQNVPESVTVLPLLMVNGWPGSVREMYGMIPFLTTPSENRDFVFEIVAPNIPGFMFSEAATKPGLGAVGSALIFKNLMNRLGFKKFYAHGGDLGSIVLQVLSVHFPDSILGFHCTMCASVTPYSFLKIFLGSVYPSWIGSEYHQKFIYPISNFFSMLLTETGYIHSQASKPDTLGYGMDDSPMGLAAYFLEKYITAANFDNRFLANGGLKENYNYDDLLDIIMLHWINRSATTSFRFYAETFNKKEFALSTFLPIYIPTICARFKYDFFAPDGVIRDVYRNLVQLNDYDGGHFTALVNPYLVSNDIFEGIAKIRLLYGKNESS